MSVRPKSAGTKASLPIIQPPILNSACPWATTFDDLLKLLESPYTGAITTRTCTLEGFADDKSVHQFVFFDPKDNGTFTDKNKSFNANQSQTGSLNTLGYSPISLEGYFDIIERLTRKKNVVQATKPIIISVTGSPSEVTQAWLKITDFQNFYPNLCMEINLSCPNIPNAPPPAYDASALYEYLRGLHEARTGHSILTTSAEERARFVPVGIKCPPYTYSGQFENLISALLRSCKSPGGDEVSCPVAFITSTNTLGSSLLMDKIEDSTNYSAKLSSASSGGIGGLGGTPIHPLSLGNVRTLRKLIDNYPQLSSIDIIGVGGVNDAPGMARMKAAGATAVGLATALGREGIDVFENIYRLTTTSQIGRT